MLRINIPPSEKQSRSQRSYQFHFTPASQQPFHSLAIIISPMIHTNFNLSCPPPHMHGGTLFQEQLQGYSASIFGNRQEAVIHRLQTRATSFPRKGRQSPNSDIGPAVWSEQSFETAKRHWEPETNTSTSSAARPLVAFRKLSVRAPIPTNPSEYVSGSSATNVAPLCMY